MIPRSLRIKIEHITQFIFDHESSFLFDFFGHFYEPELISVSFGEERINFVVVLDDGSQVSHSCTIKEYNDWFLDFPTEIRADFYSTYKRKIK